MDPFRSAVEAKDMAAAVALLADDVVFRSPVVHTPYRGRDTVGVILHAVADVFEGFRYEREIGDAAAADHALVFAAHIGDIQLQGVDLLHRDAEGNIDELVVMIRPMKAVHAVAEAMRARLQRS